MEKENIICQLDFNETSEDKISNNEVTQDQLDISFPEKKDSNTLFQKNVIL